MLRGTPATPSKLTSANPAQSPRKTKFHLVDGAAPASPN
jgi:hypothetical protein